MNEHEIIAILFWGVIGIVFLLRKRKGWDKAWYVIAVFFSVLLLTLGFDYIKNKFK